MYLKKLLKTGCIAVLAVTCNCAWASMVWEPAPASGKAPAASGGHSGHAARGRGTTFLLRDGAGAEAQIWLPTRVRRPLRVDEEGRVIVNGTGVDNFHLLLAKRVDNDTEEVAMRYISQRGKPSGESPASLVNASRAKLDITPVPLVREHQRYTSLKPYHFLITFNGKALASHEVILTTANGTSVSAHTDEQGRVTLILPDDFSNVLPGRRRNRPSEFVVRVEHAVAGRHYHTTLSAPYYVSPSHWQSTAGGLLAMFAGMVTGMVVVRRRRGASGANTQKRS